MKKFFRKKQTCKGMTLIEVIISMMIFGIMATIMVEIGIAVASMNRNANHVNRKVSIQKPLAEVENTDGILTELEDDNLRVSVTIGGASVDIAAKSYNTARAVDGNFYAQTNANIDLEFVQVDLEARSGDGIWIEETTEATT